MREFKIIHPYYTAYLHEGMTEVIECDNIKKIIQCINMIKGRGEQQTYGYVLLTHVPCMKTVKFPFSKEVTDEEIKKHIRACCCCNKQI